MEHTNVNSTMEPKEADTELRMSDEESQSASVDEAEGTTSGTIAGFETRLVRYSKIFFIFSVVAAAMAVGCITFLVLRKGAVPKTTSGKVRRSEARARWADPDTLTLTP